MVPAERLDLLRRGEGPARAEYDKAMALARPFLASVDETTRTCLFPAIDGTQSLWVVDGQGLLPRVPNAPPLPKPLPIPRLALAIELNDAKLFTDAISRYADAIRKLIGEARKAYPKHVPPELALPPPQTRDAAGGRLYCYDWPWKLGDDVFPCAFLKDKLLVLASSPKLAEEMAAGGMPMPTSAVTAPDKAAGAVAVADCAEAWRYLTRVTDAVFALVQRMGPRDPEAQQMPMLVKMHLDTLWRSLGAFRGYSSTETVLDGRVVEHSWLHVEDVP